MDVNSISAWAVVDKRTGTILVKTVSDSRRAAIVNWLVAEAGIMIYNSTTDAEIEAYWRSSKTSNEDLALVDITFNGWVT